jgi:hypothetical protein
VLLAAGNPEAGEVRYSPFRRNGGPIMANFIVVQPVVALVAGILILIAPRLLNYIVAIYLIVVGISGLAGHMG